MKYLLLLIIAFSSCKTKKEEIPKITLDYANGSVEIPNAGFKLSDTTRYPVKPKVINKKHDNIKYIYSCFGKLGWIDDCHIQHYYIHVGAINDETIASVDPNSRIHFKQDTIPKSTIDVKDSLPIVMSSAILIIPDKGFKYSGLRVGDIYDYVTMSIDSSNSIYVGGDTVKAIRNVLKLFKESIESNNQNISELREVVKRAVAYSNSLGNPSSAASDSFFRSIERLGYYPVNNKNKK